MIVCLFGCVVLCVCCESETEEQHACPFCYLLLVACFLLGRGSGDGCYGFCQQNMQGKKSATVQPGQGQIVRVMSAGSLQRASRQEHCGAQPERAHLGRGFDACHKPGKFCSAHVVLHVVKVLLHALCICTRLHNRQAGKQAI